MEDRWGTPPDSAATRLAALREGASGPGSRPVKDERRRVRYSRELILGLILVLIGAFVVLVFIGRGQRAVVVAPVPSTATPPAGDNQLPSGRALAATLVDQGSYPPELSEGDSVVIILTPQSSSEGSTRMLPETAVVASIREAASGTLGAVVTLITSESTARDMADAGTVHLAIVPRAD